MNHIKTQAHLIRHHISQGDFGKARSSLIAYSKTVDEAALTRVDREDAIRVAHALSTRLETTIRRIDTRPKNLTDIETRVVGAYGIGAKVFHVMVADNMVNVPWACAELETLWQLEQDCK